MNAKKRTSLDAVFTADEILPSRTDQKGSQRAAPAAVVLKPEELQHGKSSSRRRPGITQQTAYLPDPVYEQLRRLGFEEKRKMHTYLLEGLDRVFADRGLPAITDLMTDTRTT